MPPACRIILYTTCRASCKLKRRNQDVLKSSIGEYAEKEVIITAARHSECLIGQRTTGTLQNVESRASIFPCRIFRCRNDFDIINCLPWELRFFANLSYQISHGFTCSTHPNIIFSESWEVPRRPLSRYFYFLVNKAEINRLQYMIFRHRSFQADYLKGAFCLQSDRHSIEWR